MGLSSLTGSEYIILVGHYNKLVHKPSVDPRLLARGYTEDQIKMMQKASQEKQLEIISCNLHFKSDLSQFTFPRFNFLMTVHQQYSQFGNLPYPGTISEQPAKIIEIFNVLDSLKLENEIRQREEHQREAEKQRRKRR